MLDARARRIVVQSASAAAFGVSGAFFSPPVDAAGPLDLSRGDVRRGRRLFITCRACHNTKAGEPHKEGPNLAGVFGSWAASKSGFRYSDALQKAGFTWTPEKVNEWVSRPEGFVPGNRMAFVGLPAEQDRIDLLAYLVKETATTKTAGSEK
jgi:cytochrome c